jgi:hypothetical protein
MRLYNKDNNNDNNNNNNNYNYYYYYCYYYHHRLYQSNLTRLTTTSSTGIKTMVALEKVRNPVSGSRDIRLIKPYSFEREI